MSNHNSARPIALPTNPSLRCASLHANARAAEVYSRPRRHFAWRSLFVLGLFASAALFALLVLDGRVAVYTLNHSPPVLLAELIALSEPFGNGLSVLLVALLIWRLDPARLRKVPRLLAMAVGAGVMADTLKLFVGRWRPITGQFDPADAARSFVGWLPLFDVPSAEQSFPSAHTATAVGLALALGWLYPRGRWLFLAAPLLVGMQRIVYGSHFVSDVFVGAAVGWSVATCMLHASFATRVFQRIETPVEVHAAALNDVELYTELVSVPPASSDLRRSPETQHDFKSARRKRAA